MHPFSLALGGLNSAGFGVAGPIPVASDSTIASMRPGYRSIKTLIVDQSGAGDYTTIQAACAAVAGIQSAKAITEGTSFGPKGVLPYYRVDIVVRPGTYVELVKPTAYTAIYSSTGIQGDVVVIGDPSNGGSELGTIVTNGAIYIENIDFIRRGVYGDNPKYAIHHTAGRTAIFANCRFFANVQSSWGGWSPAGLDSNGNSYTYWYNCVFASGEFGLNSRATVNIHGFSTNTQPTEMTFAKCWGKDIGYDALSTLADTMWAKDNNATIISCTGVNTILHDSGNTGATVTYEGPHDTNGAWPIPTLGLSAQDKTYYGV